MWKWYTLKDKIPVLSEIKEFSQLPEKDRVVKQETIGDAWISTVFLGLDHSWEEGPPVLFETMIFGGEHDMYQDRYCTWEEAEEGHKKAVNLVTTKLLENGKEQNT